MKEYDKSINFRANEKYNDRLKYICDYYNINKSQLLREYIDSEYVKVVKSSMKKQYI